MKKALAVTKSEIQNSRAFPCLIRLAHLYILNKDYNSCLESAAEAVQLCPENAVGFMLKGYAELKLKFQVENWRIFRSAKLVDAEESLQYAIQLDPTMASANYLIGIFKLNNTNSSWKLKSKFQVENDLNHASIEAESISPIQFQSDFQHESSTWISTWSWLVGVVHFQRKQYEVAESDMFYERDNNGKSDAVLYMLGIFNLKSTWNHQISGRIATANKNVELAKQFFQKAIHLNPSAQQYWRDLKELDKPVK